MLVICLYSKYSQRCKEFLDELEEDIPIKMLCIDHKEVREIVMKDENGYHVRTVPCIFLFFPNGRLEKYEGSDAFVWLRKLKETREPTSPTIQTPIQTSTPLPPVESGSSAVVTEDMDDNTEKTQSVEDIMEKESQMRMASDQIITRKQDNIKEIAQMMQRQRESEEERMNPPPPGSRT